MLKLIFGLFLIFNSSLKLGGPLSGNRHVAVSLAVDLRSAAKGIFSWCNQNAVNLTESSKPDVLRYVHGDISST
jgi:hypothetical protein